MRDPGRDRPFLDQAVRGRAGRPMRLAQGQVRIILADRAVRVDAHDDRRQGRTARAGDERGHANEKA